MFEDGIAKLEEEMKADFEDLKKKTEEAKRQSKALMDDLHKMAGKPQLDG